MVLGAIGSFISDAGGPVLSATSSMVGSVATEIEAYPLLAAAVVGFGLYEWLDGSSSNNPSHLGNNVDTKA